MRKQVFLIGLVLAFLVEIAALVSFAAKDSYFWQDSVKVNEALQSVREDWNDMEDHRNQTDLDYTVLDHAGNLIFATKRGLSESVNTAVIHRDTILDIEVEDRMVGKIIIYNDSTQILKEQKQMAVTVLVTAIIVQCILCIGYGIYLNGTIIKPFHRLRDFAERVALGNLDIPLEMDRQNLFGAFTESFDIMRSELKRARAEEAKANESKKELVAKLSHDIKTPVASIKAVAEVGTAFTKSEKDRENYTQIISKADQMNTLVTNLFTATLEELKKLSVRPSDMDSRELKGMLAGADYMKRAVIPDIPECLIYADGLRLRQVFDNIFVNSYKYADTGIDVAVQRNGKYLDINVEDYGGGVSTKDLPFLKEKFRRGDNVGNKEGAGLGLYLADYFMKEMKGELLAENGQRGLRLTVRIALSGMI